MTEIANPISTVRTRSRLSFNIEKSRLKEEKQNK